MVLLTLYILSLGLIGCCNCSQLPTTESSAISGECEQRKNGKIDNWTKFLLVFRMADGSSLTIVVN